MTRTVVLGATGKTGRRVVERLRAAGREVRPVSRSTQVRMDWADTGTWDAVLHGAEAVYLVVPDSRPAPVADFLGRARRVGVHRVVLLSARGAEHGPAGSPLPVAEAAVRGSEIAWTVLRPAWFLQNFDEGLFSGQVAAGEVRLPTGQGRHPFVDADDIAAVATAALTGDGHAGATYELSGPAALTVGELVALLAEASGRTLRYTPVPVPVWIDEAVATGLPPGFAAMLAGLLDQIAHDRDAHLADGVQRALGRPPADAAAFAWRAFGRVSAPGPAPGGWRGAPAPPRRA